MADGEGSAFDELMAQMGVRRMDQAPRSGRKKTKKARKAWGKGAVPTGKAARKLTDGNTGGSVPAPASSTPEPVVRPMVRPAPGPAPRSATAVGPSAAALEQERDALQAELRAVRRELETTRDRASAVEAERERLSAELDILDTERRGLQRRLQVATGEQPEPMPALGEALQRRGILGEDEAARVLSGLVEARRVGPLLRLLEAVDRDALHAFLDDRIVLHCGGEACPVVPGRAVVRVPASRCEICGGSDVQRSVRRFVDACLLSGLRHVLVVGGSPRYHRQFRELVQHHRLQLELVPGNARRTARQAQADMARVDVVIVWGATVLDHSVADLYKGGPARVLRVAHRGMSRMLELAATGLQSPSGD